MATMIATRSDILGQVQSPSEISIDCKLLKRGIDNYHVDVHLSDYFVLQALEIIKAVVKRVIAGGRAIPGRSEELDNFRDAYEDMIKTTLHRAKTDLTPGGIVFLQFAVVKFVLHEVKGQLDNYLEELEETIAQQQSIGSRSLLPTQERLAWFRRHHDEFMYKSNRAIFQQIQREENSRLSDLRKQVLGEHFPEALNVMFNPQLSAATPNDPNLLMECYGWWPDGGTGFARANLELEEMLKKHLTEIDTESLKSSDRLQSDPEVYDTLHGLFAVQLPMGPSEDQSDLVHEKFGWLEQPGNIRLLFDPAEHDKNLELVRSELGFKAHWAFKSEVKTLLKFSSEMRKKIFTDVDLKESIAAYLLRDKWTTADQDIMEIKAACSYLAGNDAKKILARLDEEKDGVAGLINRLNEMSKEVDQQYKEFAEEKFLRLLSDLCRYRLHLKYYRFAHRIFNRIKLVAEAEEIQLSRAGGNLYELLGYDDSQEFETADNVVIHHAIIKADVRGSTQVTSELLRKGLNPASYFSTRFFNPINELLETYGASKVSVRGDEVVLGIYEEINEPQQWYSVARACGIAKEILDIVNTKNSHSRQTGLPNLEIGIGISYRAEKPFFLIDDEKPVMVSSAIAEADSLSSCSWKFREFFNGGHFSAEVIELSEHESSFGETEQKFFNYNVNGVLLANEAFKKLMSEITLKKFKIKVGDSVQTMFVGKFPDVLGKERDLIIRQGKVRAWHGGKARDLDSDEVFYEIIPNSKLASQVLDLSRSQSTKRAQK